VALVDVLHEGFDAGAFDELLLVEAAFGLSGVAGDAGDEEMGESMFLGRVGCTLLPSS
jgi:hypothetical protein